jgi:hypothetical protein
MQCISLTIYSVTQAKEQQERTFSTENAQLRNELNDCTAIIQSKVLFNDTRRTELNRFNLPTSDKTNKVPIYVLLT